MLQSANWDSLNYPHAKQVVILGAGASRAAFPKGDKNGKILPLLDNSFCDIVGVADTLAKAGIEHVNKHFEVLYSEINEESSNLELVREIKTRIRDYFGSLRIHDHITLYDKLLLSLKPEDTVATFNWDPLLLQAAARNHDYDLPLIVHLHGCSTGGRCYSCNKNIPEGDLCYLCRKPITKFPLVLPLPEKDYVTDPFIRNEWQIFTDALGRALLITIFGYSGPRTDKNARELMRKASKPDGEGFKIREVEFVDIKTEDELIANWSDFTFSHHQLYCQTLDQSYILKYPRRGVNALTASTLDAQFPPKTPTISATSLEEYQSFVLPLIEQEHQINTV